MPSYSLTHLADAALLRGLTTLVAQDRATTAALLAHLAEVDARKLYLPAAYSSLHEYCVKQLNWCEQAAYKRIRAARAASEHPAIFTAVAEGRLHLSAVVLLSPHLTQENADELITGATHRSKAEVETMLAERFPRTEALGLVQAVGAQESVMVPVSPGSTPGMCDQLSPGTVVQTHFADSKPARSVAPLAQHRFEMRVSMGGEVHAKLQRAQDLLRHQIPAGELERVLERALDALIEKLERRKFAATTQPRAPRPSRSRQGGRHIPANIRRAVWERDRGQCTFVSDAGRRCESRRFLEFDHAEPVARGGESSVANLHLRCRAHNQFMAERTYGAEFMRQKREKARERAAERSRVRDCETELAPCLEQLGFRKIEIRRAAEHCATLPGVSIEQRVRAALRILSPARPPRVLVAAPHGAQSAFTASTSFETAPLASPNSIEQRGS